jgi:hypothetical protein
MHSLTTSDQIQNIIYDQKLASLYALDTVNPFDARISELLMRNVAVASDRLTAKNFENLESQTIDAFMLAATASTTLAPSTESDRKRLMPETDQEWEYRTGVIVPLHAAQSALNSNEAYHYKDEKVMQSRQIVELGSLAFTKLMTGDTPWTNPSINSTLHYFLGNAAAAAERAINSSMSENP